MIEWWRNRKTRQARQKAFEEAWNPAYDFLAQFNAERSRGVVHDPRWVEKMKDLQRRFDEEYLPTVARLDRD